METYLHRQLARNVLQVPRTLLMMTPTTGWAGERGEAAAKLGISAQYAPKQQMIEGLAKEGAQKYAQNVRFILSKPSHDLYVINSLRPSFS